MLKKTYRNISKQIKPELGFRHWIEFLSVIFNYFTIIVHVIWLFPDLILCFERILEVVCLNHFYLQKNELVWHDQPGQHQQHRLQGNQPWITRGSEDKHESGCSIGYIWNLILTWETISSWTSETVIVHKKNFLVSKNWYIRDCDVRGGVVGGGICYDL